MKAQEHKNKMLSYKEILRDKMNRYVHAVYRLTKQFPKEEQFGSTSQLRRAALSVVLNYIEGYARKSPGYQLNFFQISYGSLKESQYLLEFAEGENFITPVELSEVHTQGNEIGAMLWTEINSLEKASG